MTFFDMWNLIIVVIFFFLTGLIMKEFFRSSLKKKEKNMLENLKMYEKKGCWISKKVFIDPKLKGREFGMNFFVDPITGDRHIYDKVENTLSEGENPYIVEKYVLSGGGDTYEVERIAYI